MELVNKIIAVSIGLFVAAIILPVALVTLANATWSGSNGSVDPAVIVVVTILLPILGVIGIAMYLLRD